MKGRKLSIFVAGIAIGTLISWVAKVMQGPSMNALTETGMLRAPGVAVWYKSFQDKGKEIYINEFHMRKLCGDDQHPCTAWLLAGVTHSDRPYPTKDIELHEGGGSYLLQMPDGHAMKGTTDGPWIVESPSK